MSPSSLSELAALLLVAMSGSGMNPGASTPIETAPTAKPGARLFTMPSLVDRPRKMARRDLVVLKDGVRDAFARAELKEEILDALDEAFLERIDLYAVLAEGTGLSLWLSDGQLVAARITTPGRSQFAALYAGPGAPTGFYDESGRSLKGPLRSRPVALGRVTSRFGERFDPILGAASSHHGVDYAVPVKTPVFAAGRGRVKERGFSASAGSYLKLAHEGGYESWYLHLSAFAKKTEPGALVEIGQQIGLSGNTGRTTGPHVHYELHLAGLPLDPQRTMPIPNTALGPLALVEHRAFLRKLEAIRGCDDARDRDQ